MALRGVRGPLNRALVRQYSSHADPATIEKGEKMWRNISLFVAIPAMVIAGVNTYIKEKEHEAHYERPPFVKYDYMRIIKKPFPWGDGKTPLFYNPRYTPKPDGWEDV